ncbi:MAG: acyl-CoA dehydrogenase family protein [Deltaproteobacteria bacterium]|nr:acyl-CoA dehydrogenase family protein [Deltaproteobacteria bacterium]
MTLPDPHNPYSFNEFLQWRENVDYWADDPFLQKVAAFYSGDMFDAVDARAREVSAKASRRWRRFAEKASRPENRPYVEHFDGHGNRVDKIVRPMEVTTMEREVFSLGLFSRSTPRWVRLVSMYLVYENGEACISCPLVCTEGLVEILDRFADRPETRDILDHCREGRNGEFGIGAQFLSEIQGGSDVPANLVEAVPGENGAYRLYGDKFFCSAVHADYALVTAKPRGSEKVALFVVPAYLPGEEKRNGHVINRIKWKMGTAELPTAEITYDGAVAWPVGPLDRGLANVVGIVLALSRLTVGLSAGAGMARGAREARAYANFRTAFGLPVARFPLAAGQLDQLDLAANRTTAGSFKVYSGFLDLPDGLKGGLVTDEPPEAARKRFRVRELVMLQKITASWDAVDSARLAMSLFGGHGVMEDFSDLPRLYRDGAVNELWEGPRNVLLTQIHRDLTRAASWYPPRELVADLLSGADEQVVKELSEEIMDYAALPHLFTMDEETKQACKNWDSFCHRLFHAYQDLALAEVEGS